MRKLFSFVVIAGSLNLFLAADTFAAHKKPKQSSAEQIKARVVQLGSGTQTNIRVKRRDGTKVTGYVAEIHANDFVVADPNTGTRTTILFSDVKQMKGKNSSTGTTVSFGGGDNASIAEFAALIGGIILVVALAIPK
jgi:hypothetical protein